MVKDRKILLNFDLEEFDLPLDYGQNISKDEQLETSYKGLKAMEAVTCLPSIQLTLFTTAFFAENFQSEIRTLSEKHEIASHTFFHSRFEEDDLKKSKEKLESITGKPVCGLRMPRMKLINVDAVLKAGYKYNSSINPTWIPGRYNNLHFPRKIFSEGKLIQLPVSVTPRFRIPLFWLTFKNIPYPLFLKLALQTLRHDGYICLYFHPWEFADLSHYKLPSYIKKDSKKLLQKLNKLIQRLSNEGEFITVNQFVSNHRL